jgi:hypothetical protein
MSTGPIMVGLKRPETLDMQMKVTAAQERSLLTA